MLIDYFIWLQTKGQWVLKHSIVYLAIFKDFTVDYVNTGLFFTFCVDLSKLNTLVIVCPWFY